MRNKEFWFFFFFLGVILFNWPFLYIFNMMLPEYFFGIWGLFIIVMGLVVTFGDKLKRGRDV